MFSTRTQFLANKLGADIDGFLVGGACINLKLNPLIISPQT